MKRRISLLLVLLLLVTFWNIQVFATVPDEENRVLYTDFLENYSSFVQETMRSKNTAKDNVKREKKDGMTPFSIKGEEGTLEGLLVKVPGVKKIEAPHFKGWVDSFMITLKYPGSVFPVLGAIHALTAKSQSGEMEHDVKVEEAYMKFNPDAQGEFRLENFKGQILEKTKEGLAKKISFNYAPGTVQDAPDTAVAGDVPVDLDGFAKRWNFEGFTSSANIQADRYTTSIKFKAFPVKTGKADEQGRVPFTMVSDNKRVKVEVKGFLLDGIVQSVAVRYIPANEKYESAVNLTPFGIKRSLYALSGADNSSGLMRYRDLHLIAGQFNHKVYYPFMFASSQYSRSGMEFPELEPILETKPFNGYQVIVSNIEENGLNVREYGFKLIEP